MGPITPNELIINELKPYEEKIVSFYKEVGDNSSLNPKSTWIFAFLQFYRALTQKQLKKLTNFSSSTISTVLHSFIQSGIVSRIMSSEARTGIYVLKTEKVSFVYTEFSQIMEDLEKFDEVIITYQKKITIYQKKFPELSNFLHMRLNSYRNYIEAQRRTIKKTKKYSFFKEDVSQFKFRDEIIAFPPHLEKIIFEFIIFLVENEDFSEYNPIFNHVYGHLGIRKTVTQDFLIKITGFSLSTISRNLNQALENELISATPKLYKKPRFYQLQSLSLSMTQYILNTDAIIFNWSSKFQRLLDNLDESKIPTMNSSFYMIKSKIESLIQQISQFEEESNLLRKNREELLQSIRSETEEIF